MGFEPRGTRVRMNEGPLPAGYGPVLASKPGVPESERALCWASIVGASVGVGLYGFCRGCEWQWAVGGGILCLLVLYVCNFKKFMRAGDGWFAYDDAFVRTDRLTHLRARFNITSGTHVTLKDADGQIVDVHLNDLGDEPKIWQLVVAGVHESVLHGLIVDDVLTARIFAVARQTR